MGYINVKILYGRLLAQNCLVRFRVKFLFFLRGGGIFSRQNNANFRIFLTPKSFDLRIRETASFDINLPIAHENFLCGLTVTCRA